VIEVHPTIILLDNSVFVFSSILTYSLGCSFPKFVARQNIIENELYTIEVFVKKVTETEKLNISKP